MKNEEIQIGNLFNELLDDGYLIESYKDYDVIHPDGIKIQTIGNKYVDLKAVSRHKTNKHLIKITCHTKGHGDADITVTTDHICMVYNKYNFFENKSAKYIEVGDYVQMYDAGYDKEVIGTITNIEDLGTTTDYVYDCEVDDDSHSFYCNEILIHNSQFVNIKCITDDFKKKYNLCDDIIKWSDEDKLKLWNFANDFVENEINPFVQKLITDNYKSEKANVLRYSMEYMGDHELIECKKHYAVRKIISEGPEIVDKIKYSGIEIKKANIPVTVKKFLKDIYSGVLTKNWKENDFKDYLIKAYDEFCKLDINDIAFWKGYNTGRESTGFLQMEKGATGISKACTFYNQLLNELGINANYDSILIGDKVRFTYIKPNNKYGINVIAFKNEFPDEFRSIFKVDYEVMWDKLIVSPLKNFIVACQFRMFDPNNQNIMSVDDL